MNPISQSSINTKTSLTPELIFEDASIVVVNKPAGLHSHAIVKNQEPTLADWLLAHYPEMSAIGYEPLQAGLVHRLDVATSGLLVAARSRVDFENLRTQLGAHTFSKKYIALCSAQVECQQIVFPIANHPRNKRKSKACIVAREAKRLKAKPALTRIEWCASHQEHTLLVASAPSAHRHQIRVHLSAIGCPLVGDVLYGGEVIEGLSRHFLHASALGFNHPRTNSPMRFTCALGADLENVLGDLGFQKGIKIPL